MLDKKPILKTTSTVQMQRRIELIKRDTRSLLSEPYSGDPTPSREAFAAFNRARKKALFSIRVIDPGEHYY